VAFPDGHEPERLLNARTQAKATKQQRELATKIGLALDGSEPRSVVATLL
jgi:hypothetical protein